MSTEREAYDEEDEAYDGYETGDEPDPCPSCGAEYDHEPDCTLAGEILRDLMESAPPQPQRPEEG